jgi:colicin import membrane protein
VSSAVRQQYVVLSVALHVAALAALTLGFKFPTYQHAPAAAAPIQGVMIDAKVLQQETERRERVAREAVERKQREERQAREAADAARRAEAEKQAAAKREQERLAAEQARKEQAAKEAREQAEAAKREQERLAKEEAAKKAAAAKAAAAARQQKQLEADLQQQLAVEGERRRLEQAGLLDQYARLIENQIERNWIPPASAKTGLECVVNVVQIPSGDVVDVRVGRCNGDDAVVRSIEAAVRRASPLPKPPDPALFERNLVVTFKPDI